MAKVEKISFSVWILFVFLITGVLPMFPGDPSENTFNESNILNFAAPENLKTSLKIIGGDRVLSTGGASNPYLGSFRSLQLPIMGMYESSTRQLLKDIEDGLRYILQTNNPWTFAVHGTGSTGMVSVLDNLIEAGDKILVLDCGFWGQQTAQAASRLGGNVSRVQGPLGSRLQLSEIEEGLKLHRPKILYLINGESSTGVLQPLDGVGELCHKYDCITVVDVIATVGQIPIKMDDNKIDVVFMNSQKGCGGIVGLAPVSFSHRAVRVLKSRKSLPRNYQHEIVSQARAWFVEPAPNHQNFVHSLSLPLLYALREGLATVVQEGIENVWKRHQLSNNYFHENAEKIGLEFFVPKKEDRLPGTTTFKVPKGKDVFKIGSYVFNKYLYEVSPGMGPTLGKVIRVGLMGNNARNQVAQNMLAALRDAIESPETNL